MFFDEVTLSKNSWHFKLQSKIFGKPPFLDNFCPYFWLTIFCVIISPFVCVGFLAFKLFTLLYFVLDRLILSPINWVLGAIEDNICEPIIVNKYKSFSDWKVYTLNKVEEEYLKCGYSKVGSKLLDKYRHEFLKWKQITGESWPEELKDITKRVKKEIKEREQLAAENRRQHEKRKKIEEEKKKARRKMFSLIAKYTKWFVTPIVIVGSTLLFLFLIYITFVLIKVFIFFIIRVWNPVAALNLLKLAGVLIVAALAVILFMFIVTKLQKCISAVATPKIKPPKVKKPNVLLLMITRFFKLLIAPFVIFVEYVKVFKSNNCPAIKWDDK